MPLHGILLNASTSCEDGACAGHDRIEQIQILKSRLPDTWWSLQQAAVRIQLARGHPAGTNGDSVDNETHPWSESSNRCLCHEHWAVLTLELADAFHHRYLHLGHLEDLEEQVGSLQSTLEMCSSAPHLQITLQLELGAALRRRFFHAANRADILNALTLHRTLFEKCSESDELHRRVILNYACSLWVYGEKLGDRNNYDQCVALLERTSADLLHSDPLYVQARLGLARALCGQWFAKGDLSCLHRASALFREALTLLPIGHPERSSTYSNLGICSGALYEQTRDIEHLAQSVDYTTKAVQGRHPLARDRQRRICNMASALKLRYNAVGDLEDLNTSIEILRQVQTDPHAFRGVILAQLASFLRERYGALGQADDLDEAVALLREALPIYPVESLHRQNTMRDLGLALRRRYERDRKIDDLLDAIELLREFVELHAKRNSARSSGVFNLVKALCEYHQHTGALTPLDEAITLCEYWMTRIENEDTQNLNRSYFHIDAGRAYKLRFLVTQQSEDIESSVSHCRAALALRPEGSMLRHEALTHLADALRQRLIVSKSLNDTFESRGLLDEALAGIPSGHIARAGILFALAKLCLAEHPQVFDVDSAVKWLVMAVEDNYHSPQKRLSGALDVFDMIAQQPCHFASNPDLRNSLLHAYSSTIKLLPRVAYFGLDVSSRLSALVKSDKLAGDSAAHALSLNDPRLALELLEQGRAVFWTQYFRLRLEFNKIPTALSGRLTDIANVLEKGSHTAAVERVPTEMSDEQTQIRVEEAAVKRRRLGDDFERLLDEVRQLPNFSRFMLPDSISTLVMAAERTAVVVLVASEVTCQAIIMRHPNEICQVALPDVTVTQLSELSQNLTNSIMRGRGRLRNRAIVTRTGSKNDHGTEHVLNTLWRQVMGQVVGSLKLKKTSGLDRPRITLCATGAFASLPLHAAGESRQTGPTASEHLSNYCVASYTPTIGALLNARKKLGPIETRNMKMFVAAVSQPAQWPSLPFAPREIELVRSIVEKKTVVTIASDAHNQHPASLMIQPTAAAVLRGLPESGILHMACHGYQNLQSPLASGFAMQDRMLTLTEVMALRLDHAFFAFLSACETAKGDKAQPNQAIHLAAAMFFAGFKSVVGTMWSMNDIDGPMVAQVVYERLFAGEDTTLHPDAIPYALDEAVQKLREQGVSASRWAPYVHLGV